MGTIRSGGIASGLDTNAIIDSLVASAKAPITALENRSHLLSLQKTLFKGVSSELTSMKSVLFNLKLESTFKSKTSTSTNASVASVTVSPSAQPGSHTIDVLQTATQASMTSMFSKPALTAKGAGAKEYSGWPGKYEQLEGDITTTVADSGAGWISVSAFKPTTPQTYKVQTFDNNISGLIDQFGNISSGITLSSLGTMNFSISIGGNTFSTSFTLNEAALNLDSAGNLVDASGTIKDINHLMSAIEQGLNDKINQYLGSEDVQFITMRAKFDGGSWKTQIYDLSGGDIVITGTGGALTSELGMNGTQTSETATTISKYHAGATAAELQAKLEDGNSSIVYQAKLTFDTGGIKEGTFKTHMDASMNVAKASATVVQSGVWENGINVNKTLTDPVASGGMGLSSSQASALLNGKITINGVTIDFSQYGFANVSINAIIGIVNSANAGVVMTYDDSNKAFKLTCVEDGSYNITMGADSDTSPFFELFKLDKAQSTTTIGSTDGGLNLTSAITSSGLPRDPVYGNVPGVFTINGVPIYVDPAKDSLNDVMSKINKSGANVNIIYDNGQDKFIIKSTKGTDKISFGSANDSSDMLRAMGFLAYVSVPKEMGNAGEPAIVKIDGQTYTRDTNNINDIIDGVAITATTTGFTTINIEVDTDKAVSQLAGFIKAYNTLMKSLSYEEISTQDREEYMTALTDEDKAGMSEDDIAKYTARYDSLHTQDIRNKSAELKSVAKELRLSIMSTLENNSSSFYNLTDIGLDIAGDDWAERKDGLLAIDSTDLDEIKNALTGNATLMNNLRNNSDEVAKFFGDYEERTETNAEYAARTSGYSQELLNKTPKKTITVAESWARRYENMITKLLDVEGTIGLKTRVDSAIDKQQQRISKQIETLQKRAEDYLERLWKQFSAMEVRVSETQSQADYIAKIGQSNSSS